MAEKATRHGIARSGISKALKTAVDGGKSDNILLAGPWGSGKTTLLAALHKDFAQNDSFHVLRFSPWDQLADGDARTGFLRLLRDELKSAEQFDPGFKERLGNLLGVLDEVLNLDAVKGMVRFFLPVVGNAVADGSRGMIKLTRALLKNKGLDPGDEAEATPKTLRDKTRSLLEGIAKANKKRKVLLLVDDLDRARPEAAVAILDSLYHLLMPHDGDGDWPLVSVWAVNTVVLEEFLYREYRELPSFDPNAYLEKIFRQRVNVPPLLHATHNSESQQLWGADIASANLASMPDHRELARALAEEVNYAILGNLRLHSRVRRDCLRLWSEECHAEHRAQKNTLSVQQELVREARLILIADAFPAFRAQIAPYNGMWPQFINRLNKRLNDHPTDMVSNPLYRHVDSPDLATILEDLKVLRYDQDRKCYVLLKEGREALQDDLDNLARKGI